MLKLLIIIFLLHFSSSEIEEEISSKNVILVIEKLDNVLNFMNKYFYEINIDGLFGLNFAKVHLTLATKKTTDFNIKNILIHFMEKCDRIKQKILNILPKNSYKTILFEKHLLDERKWSKLIPKKFDFGKIQDLGIYKNWSTNKILRNKGAAYKGIHTDFCITEILEFSNRNSECFISPLCKTMMLENRIDTGYLLTHRLLYLQILKTTECTTSNNNITRFINGFCSLIFKEARTNSQLMFPYHDIFLEQVLLCGSEGFSEFLNKFWMLAILDWQEPEGCYKSIPESFSKRTSNVIKFGCTDHSTGLASGVLALYLRFLLEEYP